MQTLYALGASRGEAPGVGPETREVPGDREETTGAQASLTLSARAEGTADAALPGSSTPPGQAHGPEEEKREGP